MSLNAIRLASEASVRDVLLGICDDDRVEEKALAYLAQLEPKLTASGSNSSALKPTTTNLKTLEKASEASVRAILIAVCDDDQTKEAALAYLALLEPDSIQSANNLPATADRRAGKRKAVGLAICVQCEEAFDEVDNRVKACLYHPGEMVPHLDDDVWSDVDPEFYNQITAENFGLSRPEGFVWSCCDQGGEETGCRFSRHVSDPARNKRARGDDSSLSSWNDEPEVAKDLYATGGQVLEEQGFLKSVDGLDEHKDTTENCDLPRDDDSLGPRDSSTRNSPPRNTKVSHQKMDQKPSPPPAKKKKKIPTRPPIVPKPKLRDFMKPKPTREVPLFDPDAFEGAHAFMQHTDDFTGWDQARDEVNAYVAAVEAWQRGTTQQVASRAARAARRDIERGSE